MTCIRLGTDSKLKGINDWTCKVTFAFLSHKSKKKKNSQKKSFKTQQQQHTGKGKESIKVSSG